MAAKRAALPTLFNDLRLAISAPHDPTGGDLQGLSPIPRGGATGGEARGPEDLEEVVIKARAQAL